MTTCGSCAGKLKRFEVLEQRCPKCGTRHKAVRRTSSYVAGGMFGLLGLLVIPMALLFPGPAWARFLAFPAALLTIAILVHFATIDWIPQDDRR